MGRPADVVEAYIDSGGNLTVVAGRGDVFVYDPGQNAEGPQSFEAAFVRGDKLYTVDSGKKPWVYDPADGWKGGVQLDAAEGQDAEAWKSVGNIGNREQPAPEEPPA